MSGIIRFKCNACGKTMGVRAAYAGKKVRCQGCQQALRVPPPRTEPAPASDPYPIKDDSGPELSLSDLAAMEQQATADVAELCHAGQAGSGGRACPSCGQSVKPGAVICVQCGHSFQSGKQLKTKKSTAPTKREREAKQSRDYSGLARFGFVWKYGTSSLILTGLGIGAMCYRLDLSESNNRKGRAIASLYNALGQP